MKYQVFISHKKEDEGKACGIKEFLEKHNVACWMDAFDPVLQGQTGAGLTKHIVDQVQESSHLLVVFTENTQKSYWVPFELGAAYQAERGIVTVKWSDERIDHPEYLDEFPILKPNDRDLQVFVEEFKKDSRVTKSFNLNEARASIGSTGAADSFIARVKQRV